MEPRCNFLINLRWINCHIRLNFLFGIQFPCPSKKYSLWHKECSKKVSALTGLQSPYPSHSYPITQIFGTWSVKKFPYPSFLHPVWHVGFVIGLWAGSIQFPFPSEWNPEAQVNIDNVVEIGYGYWFRVGKQIPNPSSWNPDEQSDFKMFGTGTVSYHTRVSLDSCFPSEYP